jgi:glucose-1-phosphate adenylyltransferase
VVTKAGIANGCKQLDLAVKVDENGEIADMAIDYVAPAYYQASMDVFVQSKKWLIQQVKDHVAHNLFHMDRDLVLGGWQAGKVSVNVYPFEGVALYNESVDDYFRNSLTLVDSQVRQELFNGAHPIYTKVRDRVPSYYGDACAIANCIVADGCMLEGSAKNSVLFRNVAICPGAEVEDCVIMNDSVIGENSQLKYANG